MDYKSHTFPISPQLLSSVKSARQRCQKYLDDKKKEEEEAALALKEKAIRDALALEQENSRRFQKLETEQKKVSLIYSI